MEYRLRFPRGSSVYSRRSLDVSIFRMKICILEYVCGVGLDAFDREQLECLIPEGFAMLRALIEDLSHQGHEINTVLNPLARDMWDSYPRVERVSIVKVEEAASWRNVWRRVALDSERTLLIAPEIDGLLSESVQELRGFHIDVWNATCEWIDLVSDKYRFAQFLGESVSHPRTWVAGELPVSDSTVAKEMLGSRMQCATDGWVLKRRDGAGCVDMRWFPELSSVRSTIANTIPVEHRNLWIVQPWIVGHHRSMAILCESSNHFQIVGVSTQEIRNESVVTYHGGQLESKIDDRLSAWILEWFGSMVGARGWIGIDFLLPILSAEDGNDSPILIEINPRLTTSYLGYRQRFGSRLADGVLGIGGAWVRTPCEPGLWTFQPTLARSSRMGV